jgi:hypothetical protein
MSYCYPSFASLAINPPLESVGFYAKLERLKWAFIELNRDPARALGTLPNKYKLINDDLITANLFEPRHINNSYKFKRGFLKVAKENNYLEKTFAQRAIYESRFCCNSNNENSIGKLLRIKWNPNDWIYRTMGMALIMSELNLAPQFLGFYEGNIGEFIPNISAKIAYGMAEIPDAISIPDKIHLLDNAQKDILADFLQTILLVAQSLEIDPCHDLQILFSLKENRPYVIDFDLWSRAIARVSRLDYINDWEKRGFIFDK